MRRNHRQFVLAPLLALSMLTASGCCTMFEFFCGPDQSEWVSVDFTTADRSLRTFMEALRRSDSRILYRCLSEGMKERYGIPGAAGFAIGWEKIKAEVPGTHLLGSATVEGPEPVESFITRQPRVQYRLERAGYVFRVTLVQQSSWEVAWSDGAELQEYGEYVADPRRHLSLNDLGDGLYRVRTQVAEGDLGSDTVSPDDIQRAGFFRDWKLDALEQVEE